MLITSPPYWSLRNYGSEPQIWDGDPSCEHEWGKWFEKRDVREETIHGKTRTTDRFYGEPSRRFNGNHQKHTAGQFCINCGAWKGELGLEPNFDLYIKHLCDIFDEIKGVLKKTGTLWVNLGDTYWSAKGSCFNPGGGKNSIETPKKSHGIYPLHRGNKSDIPNLEPKSLCQVPSRFAIEMTNRGWILRNRVIWQKANCMPSSVKDRFTVDFEELFFFSRSRRYYFEQQLEPYDGPINRWGGQKMKKESKKKKKYIESQRLGSTSVMREGGDSRPNPQGRNKRCVWNIPTKPFTEAHFAVFPEELVETPIKAGCSKGGIVLDPFIGSGTSAVVAKKLGRNFIGIDVSKEYCEMERKRVASIPGLKPRDRN